MAGHGNISASIDPPSYLVESDLEGNVSRHDYTGMFYPEIGNSKRTREI